MESMMIKVLLIVQTHSLWQKILYKVMKAGSFS